ncbi:MAG: hypothetical protein KDB22_27990, partial [Planctomycetales bacterium]|nr:hypothetical protein [Planctomycetales bacterium]
FRELGIMQLDPDGRWIENSLDFDGAIPLVPDEDLETIPPPMPVDVFELPLDQAGVIDYNYLTTPTTDSQGLVQLATEATLP